ncbi:hypothetical protein P8C59_006977 [Phyllachora maydis]|uniref:TauD/TfdA-like domain-containing protein n=1 Tax=Phyllachora maydis TaxID=1825666 RepID=A0AAD9I7H7_9PEZI|nr:hypothetical protein P8C59_006977 [Phyllachora maydis]
MATAACDTGLEVLASMGRTTTAAVDVTGDVRTLPAGFPAHVNTRLAWTGAQFANSSEYVLTLTDAHICEIQGALAHFKTLGLDGTEVGPSNFLLPTLGPLLEAVGSELYEGRGFQLVRGLNPADYSVEDLNIVWFGMQSFVAAQRGRQDRAGNMLVHIVADDSTKDAAEHHRHSNKAITFHNEERGDIISWLTRGAAAEGGQCVLSSAHTVYNVLAATRPDLVRVLARADWPFSMPRFHCRPILFHQDGKLIINFGRTPLLGSAAHPRPADLPGLSPVQVEALDAVERIARATELAVATRPGDLHFVNNLALLHRRGGYVDGAARRHLVRMYLRSPRHAWPVPAPLQRDWDRAFGERGPRAYHLEPMPPFYFPLRSHPN